jgi:hypothetical protein
MLITKPGKAQRRQVGYHDLLDDLGRPGCPACHGANRAARRYIDGLLWEFVNDSDVRARLRGSHGFCREHAFLALEQANGLGIAILYEDFLRHLRGDAIRAARGRAQKLPVPRRRPDPARLAPHGECPACESGRHVAANYLRILATADPESEIDRAAGQELRGLCIPHLAQGLELASSKEDAERLLAVYLRGEAELRADLHEFIRKERYQHRDEPPGREVGAWQRAVHRVVGEPLRRNRPFG